MNEHKYTLTKKKTEEFCYRLLKTALHQEEQQGVFLFLMYPPASFRSLKVSITLHLSDKSSYCPSGAPAPPFGLSPSASARTTIHSRVSLNARTVGAR